MHPVGPRGPGVYWVRRAVVIVVAVVVVVGVGWMLTHRGAGPDVNPAASTETTEASTTMTGVLASARTPGADDQPGATDAADAIPESAADGSAPADSPLSPTSGAPVTPTTGTAAGSSNTVAATGTSETGTKTAGSKNKVAKTSASERKSTKGKASKSQASKTKTAAHKPGKSSTSKATPTTTAPPKPSYDDHGRLICADGVIGVTAKTRSKSYPVGAQPVLVLTVTNTGHQPCVRDVSGKLQTFTVYTAGGDRVWSTDDCFPGKGTGVYRFQPGESRPYPVTWAGTTSTPGCRTERTTVEPGDYTVVAKLGALKTKPYPFTMTTG